MNYTRDTNMDNSIILVGFPGGTVVNNLPVNAGVARDPGLIPGLGRSPGEGSGKPFKYSCLGNPMDRGAWQGTVQGCSPRPLPQPPAALRDCTLVPGES